MRCFLILLLIGGVWPVSSVHAATQFGIRFLVNDTLAPDAAARQALRERLAGQVAVVNRYYRDSLVDLTATIVDVAFIPIAEEQEGATILDQMRHEKNGFAALYCEAGRHGAAYTVAVTRHQLRGKRGCGQAIAVNKRRAELSRPEKALMVYDIVCGSHTLAHELGHLMGLNHGRLVDRCEPGHGHTTAIASYALGYGVGNCDGQMQPGEFGTIMVGGWMKRVMGNDKASLPLFSNPQLKDPRCGKEGICGDPETGDAARALNENATEIVALTKANQARAKLCQQPNARQESKG
ncbi:MAG: M12 family metallo-peptidase [Magnetococcus sp. YQC-9]